MGVTNWTVARDLGTACGTRNCFNAPAAYSQTCEYHLNLGTTANDAFTAQVKYENAAEALAEAAEALAATNGHTATYWTIKRASIAQADAAEAADTVKVQRVKAERRAQRLATGYCQTHDLEACWYAAASH